MASQKPFMYFIRVRELEVAPGAVGHQQVPDEQVGWVTL
jgi:hypothetical protein